MKDFAFYCEPEEVSYFTGVIKNIPKEIIDVHVATYGQQNSFHNLPVCIRNSIQDLIDNGYCISPLDVEKLLKYRSIALSFKFFASEIDHLGWRTVKTWPNLIYLMHDASFFGLSWDLPPHFYIMASKGQALAPEKNKVSKETDPEKYAEYMSLPKNMVNEFAYTGPYQLNEWCKNRNLPRQQLREMLERKLGACLPKDKPIIVFFEDEYCDRKHIMGGLRKLAPYASIIIKCWSSWVMPDVLGIYRWPDQSYAPNLLRFGADYIMAGYQSGTLSTSTMLGLKIIPYYTDIVYINGNWDKAVTSSYTYFLPGQTPNPKVAAKLPTRIMDVLNPPINIMDTQGIMNRINSSEWWSDYNKRLPGAQKSIFGDYSIDDAPEKTAGLIMRVFEKNTFGKDAVGVRLRPEFEDSPCAK